MAPWRDVVRLSLRIAPAAACVGFFFEAFMHATGFWKVATRKEAERVRDAQEDVARLRAAARARNAAAGAPGLQ